MVKSTKNSTLKKKQKIKKKELKKLAIQAIEVIKLN